MPPSIHKKLYPRKGNYELLVAGILGLIVMLLVNLTSPTTIWIEIITVGSMVGFMYFFTRGIFGKNKWSLILTIGVLGFLIMGRWGILDFLLAGLWFSVLILISLFN